MSVNIRPMVQDDLPTSRRVLSLAFGTFLGVPDPAGFWSDLDYAGPRWRADPEAAFVAELDGQVIGSGFATRWGSVGFFGPLTVHPEHWGKNVGQQLLEPIMGCFKRWQVSHAGLFTFAHSAMHVHLYQKYGFWPRALTAVMSKPVTAGGGWVGLSSVSGDERERALAGCRALAHANYPGLDLSQEINAIATQELGETVLLRDEAGDIRGFAAVHCGRDTEAGEDKALVKFAAVAPADAVSFEALLDACEALASSRGLSTIDAGVSLACEHACRIMIARGFRTGIQGVAMHRPNVDGYHAADRFVIDDWR
jgi:GNAT superfamily N-acetyltransferase